MKCVNRFSRIRKKILDTHKHQQDASNQLKFCRKELEEFHVQTLKGYEMLSLLEQKLSEHKERPATPSEEGQKGENLTTFGKVNTSLENNISIDSKSRTAKDLEDSKTGIGKSLGAFKSSISPKSKKPGITAGLFSSIGAMGAEISNNMGLFPNDNVASPERTIGLDAFGGDRPQIPFGHIPTERTPEVGEETKKLRSFGTEEGASAAEGFWEDFDLAAAAGPARGVPHVDSGGLPGEDGEAAGMDSMRMNVNMSVGKFQSNFASISKANRGAIPDIVLQKDSGIPTQGTGVSMFGVSTMAGMGVPPALSGSRKKDREISGAAVSDSKIFSDDLGTSAKKENQKLKTNLLLPQSSAWSNVTEVTSSEQPEGGKDAGGLLILLLLRR